MQYEFTDDATAVFPVRVETESLIFEAVHADGHTAVDVYELFTSVDEDGEAFEYTDWEYPATVFDVQDHIRECRQQWEEGTRAEYLIYKQDNDKPVGVTHLSFEREFAVSFSGIWFLPEARGQGYFREWADAFMEYRFEEMEVDVARLQCLVENAHSFRAIRQWMADNGGTYEGIRRWGGKQLGHVFSITREQYRGDDAGISTYLPVDVDDLDPEDYTEEEVARPSTSE